MRVQVGAQPKLADLCTASSFARHVDWSEVLANIEGNSALDLVRLRGAVQVQGRWDIPVRLAPIDMAVMVIDAVVAALA
eukprot:11227800-Lingulodinium_polyedra.AAC.1